MNPFGPPQIKLANTSYRIAQLEGIRILQTFVFDSLSQYELLNNTRWRKYQETLDC